MAIKRYNDIEDSQVDMNPMLDIVFILLIFFIVTASFQRDYSIDVDKSKPNLAPPNQQTITPQFIIDEHNKVYLNGREIKLEAVNVNLARLASNGEITAVSVRAHNNSQHNTLMTVLNEIKSQTQATISMGEPLN